MNATRIEEQLPNGWKATTLADLIVDGPTNGYSPVSSTNATGPLTLKLSATTSGEMRLNSETTKRIHEQIPSDSKFWLQDGDLLIQRANTLEYVGAAAIYEGPSQTYIYPDLMMRIRITDPATRKFVWRYINSQQARQHFRNLATGTAGNMPKINGTVVRELPIQLPPLPEQRRIVSKLESVLARSRRAKEALDAIPALLERFRQSVLAAAFRGDLTADWRAQHPDVEPLSNVLARLPTRAPAKRRASADATPIEGRFAISAGPSTRPAPEGWTWVQLTNVARLETGHTPSRSHPEYWGGGIPWIGIKDARANHGSVIQQTEQTVTQAGLDNSAARLLPTDTVCLSRTASVGYVFVLGRSMATSQDFVCWVCSEAVVPKFLMYLLMAEGEDIRRFGKGSTHTTIYFPEVMAFHVCLPSVSEQQQIVQQIEARFAAIERLREAWQLAQQSAQKLDEALLAKAFRGELVPQDPNDEPATVLLERIRAEREATAGSAPKRPRGRRPAA